MPSEQVERALAELAEKGYVEQYGEDRWRVTGQGSAIQDSLIGTRYQDGTAVWVHNDGSDVAAEFVSQGSPQDARHDPTVGTVRDGRSSRP